MLFQTTHIELKLLHYSVNFPCFLSTFTQELHIIHPPSPFLEILSLFIFLPLHTKKQKGLFTPTAPLGVSPYPIYLLTVPALSHLEYLGGVFNRFYDITKRIYFIICNTIVYMDIWFTHLYPVGEGAERRSTRFVIFNILLHTRLF